MFIFDNETLIEIERQLNVNCPSPEKEIARLCQIAANLPASEVNAFIRFIVFDIDDFVCQIRWNLGQALLLLNQFPQIAGQEMKEKIGEIEVSNSEAPLPALLLLRGYIRDADKVLYSNFNQLRRGSTVAGWVFQIMIDDAINRAVATLDRLARILWYVAKLPNTTKKGHKVKVYFRDYHMRQIHERINNNNSEKLLKVANNPVVKYIIQYRDGFAHEMKAFSLPAGPLPSDEWTNLNGIRIYINCYRWDAETIFSLAKAAYVHLIDALLPTIEICDDYLKHSVL